MPTLGLGPPSLSFSLFYLSKSLSTTGAFLRDNGNNRSSVVHSIPEMIEDFDVNLSNASTRGLTALLQYLPTISDQTILTSDLREISRRLSSFKGLSSFYGAQFSEVKWLTSCDETLSNIEAIVEETRKTQSKTKNKALIQTSINAFNSRKPAEDDSRAAGEVIIQPYLKQDRGPPQSRRLSTDGVFSDNETAGGYNPLTVSNSWDDLGDSPQVKPSHYENQSMPSSSSIGRHQKIHPVPPPTTTTFGTQESSSEAEFMSDNRLVYDHFHANTKSKRSSKQMIMKPSGQNEEPELIDDSDEISYDDAHPRRRKDSGDEDWLDADVKNSKSKKIKQKKSQTSAKKTKHRRNQVEEDATDLAFNTVHEASKPESLQQLAAAYNTDDDDSGGHHGTASNHRKRILFHNDDDDSHDQLIQSPQAPPLVDQSSRGESKFLPENKRPRTTTPIAVDLTIDD